MDYITFRNGKLKKDNIGVFKLPPIKSCPFRGECEEYCYATVGTFRFKHVEDFMERSFKLAQSDEFVEVISGEIQETIYSKGMDTLRLHSSGDFFCQEYFDKWMSIARSFPEVTFYAYTKALPYLKWDKHPDNFIIIQSYGGWLDDEIDKSKKHAKVFTSWDALNKAGYVNASYSDMVAIDPRVTKIGLVAHGAKKVYVK